jgi:hypothetical protein
VDEALQLDSCWNGAKSSRRDQRGVWLRVFENVPNREECSEAYESKLVTDQIVGTILPNLFPREVPKLTALVLQRRFSCAAS